MCLNTTTIETAHCPNMFKRTDCATQTCWSVSVPLLHEIHAGSILFGLGCCQTAASAPVLPSQLELCSPPHWRLTRRSASVKMMQKCEGKGPGCPRSRHRIHGLMRPEPGSCIQTLWIKLIVDRSDRLHFVEAMPGDLVADVVVRCDPLQV